MPLAILLLKTKDLGLALASIPLYYTISNIAYAIFSGVAGRYADKFGANKILVGGYLSLILGYITLMNATSVPILILGFLFVGLFSALTDGVSALMPRC